MVQNGDVNKQLWATEVGAPDGTHFKSVTPAQQAPLFTDRYNLWRQYPSTGPLFRFNYNDADAGTTGSGFGIGTNPEAVSAYTSLTSGN